MSGLALSGLIVGALLLSLLVGLFLDWLFFGVGRPGKKEVKAPRLPDPASDQEVSQ
jgi:hypothetical protein